MQRIGIKNSISTVSDLSVTKLNEVVIKILFAINKTFLHGKRSAGIHSYICTSNNSIQEKTSIEIGDNTVKLAIVVYSNFAL